MDIHIKINNLSVMSVGSSSGIFSGDNYHLYWSAMNKSNTGAELSGAATFSSDSLNIVNDSDFFNELKRPPEKF